MRIKRFIAVIAVFALCFTQLNFIIGSAEEATENASIYQDSELASFEEKLDMLVALGVIPALDKKPEDTLSRSDFAGIIAMALGKSLYECSFEENTYLDVKELTDNAQAIVSLKKMGLMVGVNNVEFRPNDSVTYAQAVKVLVSALGYKELAEVSGGYYNGYLKKAIDLDILRAGAANYDRALSWYDAVLMMDAALEASVPELYSIGEKVYYTDDDERNLLSVYHDIYKIEAIMTDNGQTALNGKSAVGLNNALIGDILMTDMPEKFTWLIGKNVVAYYKAGDNNEFRYAYSNDAKNDILVIGAYELLTENQNFTKTNIWYKNSAGKGKSASVSPYADFIYNGAAYTEFVSDTLKIKTGTLTLIDNNFDRVYDTVIADTFEDFLVATKNNATQTLYSNYQEAINYSEYDVVHFYNAEGEKIEIADIPADSLLSVYKSKDKTKLIIYLSQVKNSLVIDSVTEDEDGIIYVKAGESEYRVARFYMDAMLDEKSPLRPIVAGAKYDVYVNVMGEAAMFLETQNREEYAYLLAVGIDNEALTGSKPVVKIVNEQGDCLSVKAAKKYTVVDSRGTYENDSSMVTGSADLFDLNGNFTPQLIRIKINSKGEFTKLEYDNTAPEDDETVNGFDETRFVCNLQNASGSFYTGYGKNFSGQYFVDENTKIFLIEDVGSIVTTDETKIKVVKYSDFKLTYIIGSFYDVDRHWNAGALVCSQTTGGFDDRAFTVLSSKTIIDEFGEERVQVKGYWKNNIWEFREHTPGVFAAALEAAGYTGIKTGDMFRIGFDNPKQEITIASLIASPSRNLVEGRGVFAGSNYATATHAWVIGVPVTATDSSIGIMANGEYWVDSITSSTYVTVLDLGTGELTKVEEVELPTIGSVDKDGNIDAGDRSIMIVGQRLRHHIQDIIVVIK